MKCIYLSRCQPLFHSQTNELVKHCNYSLLSFQIFKHSSMEKELLLRSFLNFLKVVHVRPKSCSIMHLKREGTNIVSIFQYFNLLFWSQDLLLPFTSISRNGRKSLCRPQHCRLKFIGRYRVSRQMLLPLKGPFVVARRSSCLYFFVLFNCLLPSCQVMSMLCLKI